MQIAIIYTVRLFPWGTMEYGKSDTCENIRL